MNQHLRLDDLLAGDRRALAKSITLVESTLPADRMAANTLVEAVLAHTGNSFRIGISGVPGVGKSTFIDAFGMYLIGLGKRVAVLAVDPSSPIAGGSILGDKTRMPALSRSELAFIRPSPSAGLTGGIAHRTRESVLLCEAAGYDVILVETVGVGQSEVEVHDMVDFFLLLMVPNAGDDLQGIKRGITELVDAILINKADGESLQLARLAQQHYATALRIIRNHRAFWVPEVLLCSSMLKTNLDKVWSTMQKFLQAAVASDEFGENRKHQTLNWMRGLVNREIEQRLREDERLQSAYPRLEQQVIKGAITPLTAANELIELLFNGQANPAGGNESR